MLRLDQPLSSVVRDYSVAESDSGQCGCLVIETTEQRSTPTYLFEMRYEHSRRIRHTTDQSAISLKHLRSIIVIQTAIQTTSMSEYPRGSIHIINSKLTSGLQGSTLRESNSPLSQATYLVVQ
jgi:hypothetical protein